MVKKTTVIIGPTASGKSKRSIAMAQAMGAAVISADAFQIYRDFNIGTGTLSTQDMAGVPHYLVSERHPEIPYCVDEFIKNVANIMRDHPDQPVIICGGSAMYLKALLYSYRPLKRCPAHQRPQGTPNELWHQLHAIDPVLAQKTHPNNKRRVQRYLELAILYDRPPSELFESTPINPHQYDIIGISVERSTLKTMINHRIDGMIQDGLVDEVRELMKRYSIDSPAFHAIGYRDVVAYLNQTITKDKMIDSIKTTTYRYAKRQMTWFRTFDHVHWQHQ